VTYPLGVDIGTTYTAAALWREGRVQTVPLGNRANAVPSVLFLRDDNTMLVGEAAARRGITDPDRQAREFKRRMGDDVPILLGGRGYTAHQLTGEVLRWSLQKVSELQGSPPQHVVLTHPASWGEFRKGLLTQSAMAAGLREVGLLPEPVAAATWYAAQERIEPGSLIGIYDFGGGTFDASVVRKTATGVEIFGEAGGDDSIGGIDFDHALFRHVGASAGVDIAQLDMTDPMSATAMAQLFTAVVEAKEALSSDVEVVVPVVLPGLSRQVLVTRAEFEELIRQRVLGTVGVFGQVVRRAGVDPAKLHGVLLVGGSSRIPLVRQLLSAELGIRVAVDAHPKYTVSLGAAIAAAPRVVGARSLTDMARPMTPPGPARPMPPPPPGPPIQNQYRQTQSRSTYQSGYHQQPQPGPPNYPPPHGPGQRSVQVPVPPPPPPPAPAVSEKVDLARSGLTGITDVRAVLASIQPSEPVVMTPPPRTGNQFNEFRTRDTANSTGSGRGRLIALLVVLLIVAVVAVVLFVLNNSSNNGSSGTTTTGTSQAPAVNAAPTVGKITLTGGSQVIPPPGEDQMVAVTGLDNGHVVAVGYSDRRLPRAWVYPASGDLTPANVQTDDQGQMLDVTTLGSTAVAVGWTGVGPRNRAAVWTSQDGSVWTLVPADGDFKPGTDIKQITAVTMGADNKLLAIARDDRADRVDGDSAVYTSVDGKTWTGVPATGLTGTGPQDVVRLIRAADNSYQALGASLQGAKRGPAIWTSTDGVKWDSSPYIPGDLPSLQGIAKQADGKLLVCGSIGAGDSPTPSCWTQAADRWERWDVATDSNSPRAVQLYGMYTAEQFVVVVGLGQTKDKDGKPVNDAAIWTMSFGPRK
jgi:actin-like ATPase involved in cell morphogenesis